MSFGRKTRRHDKRNPIYLGWMLQVENSEHSRRALRVGHEGQKLAELQESTPQTVQRSRHHTAARHLTRWRRPQRDGRHSPKVLVCCWGLGDRLDSTQPFHSILCNFDRSSV